MLEGVDMAIYLFFLPSDDGKSRGEPVGMGGENLQSAFLSSSRSSSFLLLLFPFSLPYPPENSPRHPQLISSLFASLAIRLRAHRCQTRRRSRALQPLDEHDHAWISVRLSELRRERIWECCEFYFLFSFFLSFFFFGRMAGNEARVADRFPFSPVASRCLSDHGHLRRTHSSRARREDDNSRYVDGRLRDRGRVQTAGVV